MGSSKYWRVPSTALVALDGFLMCQTLTGPSFLPPVSACDCEAGSVSPILGAAACVTISPVIGNVSKSGAGKKNKESCMCSHHQDQQANPWFQEKRVRGTSVVQCLRSRKLQALPKTQGGRSYSVASNLTKERYHPTPPDGSVA